MVKYYEFGKDTETLPCIELDDGTVITTPEVVLAIVMKLIEKRIITQDDLKPG